MHSGVLYPDRVKKVGPDKEGGKATRSQKSRVRTTIKTNIVYIQNMDHG